MKAFKPLPPINVLREHFVVTKDGLVRCKATYGEGGYIPAGTIAGSAAGKRYRYVYFKGQTYLVHRLVYFMAYGVDPEQMLVDHIDGDPLNNNPVNLRLATPTQNMTNQQIPVRKTFSGIRGVHRSSTAKHPFAVHMRINGRQRHLGCFKTVDEASEFAELARAMAYGEFAGSD